MHTFIDGYNVTRSDPATRDLPLEEQRSALETRMRLHASALIGTGGYTIVWDAAGGEGVVHRNPDNVAYTRKRTADDSIVGRVKASKKHVRVVTSDRELINRCKSAAQHGVDIVPSSRLYESAVSGGSAPAKGKKKPRMSRDVGIPANANEINEELKRLWGED